MTDDDENGMTDTLGGMAIIIAAMEAQGVNRFDQLRPFCTPHKCFQASGHDGECDDREHTP